MTLSKRHSDFARPARAALDDPPPGVDPWFRTYCGDLADDGGLERYLRSKHQLVSLAGGVAGRDVLDAGSGFGMVANLLAEWGARSVVALEVHEPMIRSHRRLLDTHFSRLESVHPVRGDVSRMPCADRSIDLVLSIEAISHYFDVESFLDECARVLRPGGYLVVSDGNNGANPRIRAAVEELWTRIEMGPPGEVHGHAIEHPMTDRRAAILREDFPQLDEEHVVELARATSGYDRAQIRAAVSGHLAGGPAPDSHYATGTCPREPYWGYLIERLFDPLELRGALEARGFTVRAWPHYGGARNDLVMAANAFLRLVPTFRYARAFRIVARREG